MKNVRKTSSSATRLSTIPSPSMAMSPDATEAKTIDPVSVRAKRYTARTVAVPNTTAAIRQPVAVSAPKRAMPAPMNTRPSGGCTT
ncbi:hypothetical protein SRABI128_04678 [Microbacterium sp. Bi128]|nr:hypothetical protein SRABI128_04678 [Microbacterium sp. Bi128]